MPSSSSRKRLRKIGVLKRANPRVAMPVRKK